MESTEKVMTLKEILIDVCKVLGDIDVPAAKIEQIGIPIARSINGIKLCIDAISKDESDKPKLEIVPEKEGEENK